MAAIGAYVEGPNPIQDLINGMVQGVQLHDQLQRASDEHDAMQRAALQQARENRIQDITQKMMLGANSRPVNPDGTVTEQSELPAFSMAGIDMPSQPVSYARKADKSRTVTYTDQDGNAMQRELLTPMEQIQRQVTATRAGQTDVSGILQQMLPQPGAGAATEDTPYGEAPTMPSTMAGSYNAFPNGVYVNPAQVPGIMGDLVRAQNNQRTNDTKQTIADGKLTPPAPPAKLTKTYVDNSNQMVGVYSDGSTKVLGQALVKPAGRGAALTPNAQAVQTRSDQRQQQADQRTVDSLQQQEQKLHGQRQALGDAIGAKDGATVPDPLNPSKKVTVNAAYRELWKTRLDQATAQVQGLQQTQTRLINKWGGANGTAQPAASGASAPGRGPAATAAGQKSAPVQSGTPKKGDKQTYQGANYEFNGTQWVRK